MSFKIEFDIPQLLSESSKSEVPISFLTSPFFSKSKSPKETETSDTFSIKETTTGEESISILYQQGPDKMYISIYGPREMKFREKLNGEHAKLEIFTKFSTELGNEEQELIEKYIKNYAKKVIKLNSYPKCQITLGINVFSSQGVDCKYSLIPKICNGIMMGLGLSGINLNMMCLGKGFLLPENQRGMVFLEVNNNDNDEVKVFDIETEEAFDMEFYENIINKTKKSFEIMNKKFQNIVYKKLTNQW